MAYEVTKRIKGREYRYRVEGYRDPETGRTRTHWRYLGKVAANGVVSAPVHRSGRTTREKIVAATAELLESRDASRVTVAVIAGHAGISQATFYRYFPDRKAAFTGALTYLADRTLQHFTLDGPLGTIDDERSRLREWIGDLHRDLLRQRAFRWLFAAADRSKAKGRVERSLLKRDARTILRDYLLRLEHSGLAQIDDADVLAESIVQISGAFIRFTASDELTLGDRPLPIADAYPVIERAIFGASAMANARVIKRGDG